jgi:hypothetical protein
MKKIFELETTIIGLIVAGIVFLTYRVQQIQELISNVGWFGEIAIPSAIFVTLYQVVLSLYRNLLWQLIHKKHSLNGYWVYKLHDQITNRWLYGYFEIIHVWNEISIPSGRVWYWEDAPSENNRRGSWSSNHISLEAKRMWVIFDMMNGPAAVKKDEIGDKGKGSLELVLEDTPTSLLEGWFRDFDERNMHKGSVTCKRVGKSVSLENIENLLHDNFEREKTLG